MKPTVAIQCISYSILSLFPFFPFSFSASTISFHSPGLGIFYILQQGIIIIEFRDSKV